MHQVMKLLHQDHLGLDANKMATRAKKPVFGGLQTTQAQTSLYIRAVWSVPLLFWCLESIICELAAGEISIF